MYAVFRTGGKQYRASEGQRLRVERLDASVGDAVEFGEVLLVGQGADIKVGSPLVSGGKVEAKVTAQGREPKIEVIKFKRRTHYKRTYGHRQYFTEVEITSITGAGGSAEKSAKREADEPAAAETAARQAQQAAEPVTEASTEATE